MAVDGRRFGPSREAETALRQRKRESVPEPTDGAEPRPLDPVSLRRAVTSVRQATAQDILALQRTIGNREVKRLLQTKLAVRQPDDTYEWGADRAAWEVLQMPERRPDGQAEQGDGRDEERAGVEPILSRVPPLTQRQAEGTDEEASEGEGTEWASGRQLGELEAEAETGDEVSQEGEAADRSEEGEKQRRTPDRAAVMRQSDPTAVKKPKSTVEKKFKALVAASKFNDAIALVIRAYKLPTTNLNKISYNAGLSGADAITSGKIGKGERQTVAVGPTAFAESFAHCVKIIGHELQHVQQRSGKKPIRDSNTREFLAYAWEALDKSSPALTPQDRVVHANAAIQYYSRIPEDDQPKLTEMLRRLRKLIADKGRGNP